MYKIMLLVILIILALFMDYISHPRLTDYPQIITKIDSISKAINTSIKNINYGGCGYFAYYLTDLLDSVDLRYEICVLNIQKDTNHITHVLVYLPDYNLFIDSRGVYNGIKVNGNKYFYCFKISKIFSKQQLGYVVSTFKWNKRYDTMDTIQIKNRLRI